MRRNPPGIVGPSDDGHYYRVVDGIVVKEPLTRDELSMFANELGRDAARRVRIHRLFTRPQ